MGTGACRDPGIRNQSPDTVNECVCPQPNPLAIVRETMICLTVNLVSPSRVSGVFPLLPSSCCSELPSSPTQPSPLAILRETKACLTVNLVSPSRVSDAFPVLLTSSCCSELPTQKCRSYLLALSRSRSRSCSVSHFSTNPRLPRHRIQRSFFEALRITKGSRRAKFFNLI